MKKFSKIILAGAFAVSTLFSASCSSGGTTENAEAAQAPETVAAEPGGTIKITVSTTYEPKSVNVKKGQPVKLAFFRKDDKNCGDEVVFPKLGIKKKLAVGETVLVEFTPSESGEIAFNCGMDMMRGKVVVAE